MPVDSEVKLLRDLAKLRVDNSRLRGQNNKLAAHGAGFDTFLDELKKITEAEKKLKLNPAIKKKIDTTHSEIACVAVSDIHLGEQISREATLGSNYYNSVVCANRLWEYCQKVKRIIELHLKAYNIEKIWSPLLGDCINSNLHEGLITNDISEQAQVILCTRLLTMFYSELATLGIPIEISTACGNHPRTTPQVAIKRPAYSNLDWMVYEFLHDSLKSNNLISMDITKAAIGIKKLYDFNYVFEHGISVKPGQEEQFEDRIRGILDDPSFRQQTGYKGTSFDQIVIGNMHKPKFLERTIVNGCFTEDAEVTKEDGTRSKIKDIRIGDKVLGIEGQFNSVLNTQIREYTGNLVSFRFGSKSTQINCTENHKIYAVKNNKLCVFSDDAFTRYKCSLEDIKPEWIEAKNLSEGDYVVLNTPNHCGVTLEKEFCRFIGLYLAEGSASGRNGKLHHIDFTFHEKEESYARFIEKFCQDRWGSSYCKLRIKKDGSKTWIAGSYSTEAAKEMVELCGKGAKNKKLNINLMYLSSDSQKFILAGWVQGDGHISTKKVFEDGRKASCSTISKELCEQMFIISLRSGLIPKLLINKKIKNNENTSYTLSWGAEDAQKLSELTEESFNGGSVRNCGTSKVIGGFHCVQITAIVSNYFHGNVYNLSVENDHSYTVNGVGVANSFSGNNELGVSWRLKPVRAQQLMWGVSKKHVRTWQYQIDLTDQKSDKADNPMSEYTKWFLKEYNK